MPDDTFDPRRPFTRSQARTAGIGPRELTGPKFQRLFYDLYISSAVPVTTRVRASAVLSVSPAGAFLSHSTAAELWGGVVPDDPDIHVSTPTTDGRSRRRGIRSHVAPPSCRAVTVGGLPATGPAQAFLDLARTLSVVELVVLGDSLVKAGSVTPERLQQITKLRGMRNVRAARRAALLVRRGVDSPMETRLRMLIVLAGLPEPIVNHVIWDGDGRWRMRFDLAYPRHRLLIEYDGRQHAEDDRQWARDIERREDLDRDGWRLIVIRAPDVYRCPERTLMRLATAIRECSVPLPGGWSGAPDEWHRLFPGARART